MIIDKQKGVSLIITFFIMVIILAIVFSISLLLYSEAKIIRNMGNSVMSFYAADSGVEKVLYFDRKVLPDKGGERGLCVLYESCPDSVSADSGIYCKPNDGFAEPVSGTPNGCDPEVCDDCQISFSSVLDDNLTYSVTAQVTLTNYLDIKSTGNFGGTERKIETSSNAPESGPNEAISIQNTCADPGSVPTGTEIKISADVVSTYEIVSVTATIYHYNSQGNIVIDIRKPLSNDGCDLLTYCNWGTKWSTNNIGTYYVDLEAVDNKDQRKTYSNVKPCWR
jgi:hypothetical protein